MDVVAACADKLQLNPSHIKSILDLSADGHTVPFIARYRADCVGGLDGTAIRSVLAVNDELTALATRRAVVTKAIIASGCDQTSIVAALSAVRGATSSTELEDVYAPFKSGKSATKSAQARECGAGPLLELALSGAAIEFRRWLRPKTKASSVKEIQQALQVLLAEHIANDQESRTAVREAFAGSAELQSVRSRSSCKTYQNKNWHEHDVSKVARISNKGVFSRKDNDKFAVYANFSAPVGKIKGHQVLAINRGERKKELTISILLSPAAKAALFTKLSQMWIPRVHPSVRVDTRTAVQDAMVRLLQPRQSREIRSQLTNKANRDALRVFRQNLRAMLLARPVAGQRMLAIDPGFRNGCKVAVIDEHGEPLAVDTVFPHPPQRKVEDARVKLVALLKEHKCALVAIGNGTACRETECFVATLRGEIPELRFTMVNETGASIYSVSDAAVKELPKYTPAARGAISLARRVQDPLAELLKIDPQHLGVGMYQHDIKSKLLETELDAVVEDCVALVGVDLNDCSEHLLRRVPGLNVARAAAIVKHRKIHGPFKRRAQLTEVKGIGKTSFMQAAGFVRVPPSDATACCTEAVLDNTCIHPESFPVACLVLRRIGAEFAEIGTDEIFAKVSKLVGDDAARMLLDYSGPKIVLPEGVSSELPSSHSGLELVLRELLRPRTYDARKMFSSPLFRKEVISLLDVRQGMVLTGRVQNVTDFGAFVDLGVGLDGLVHSSEMLAPLVPGQCVTVQVCSIDTDSKRIGLCITQDSDQLPNRSRKRKREEHKAKRRE